MGSGAPLWLSDEEWNDLADICQTFLAVCRADECGLLDAYDTADMGRMGLLCERVIDAVDIGGPT